MALTRRQFFRGEFGSRGAAVIRPPWALPEQEFQEICSRCSDCVRACGQAILVRGSGGYPEVDFRYGACTFCGGCADACEPKALQGTDKTPEAAWRLEARISDLCLSKRGVICRACADACESNAIRFRLQVGGRAEPLFFSQRCNGCGACVSVCPDNLVALRPDTEAGDRCV